MVEGGAIGFQHDIRAAPVYLHVREQLSLRCEHAGVQRLLGWRIREIVRNETLHHLDRLSAVNANQCAIVSLDQ
jgi:hypothetical protein